MYYLQNHRESFANIIEKMNEKEHHIYILTKSKRFISQWNTYKRIHGVKCIIEVTLEFPRLLLVTNNFIHTRLPIDIFCEKYKIYFIELLTFQ